MNKQWRTMHFLLLAWLFALAYASEPPGDWEKPYFVSMNPEQIEVPEYEEDINTQTIFLWEEINPPYKLVQINYRGSQLKIVSPAAVHGAQLVLEENKWFIIINNRLDYEQPAHRNFVLMLEIENDAAQMIPVQLKLVNILDNVPVMSSVAGACRVNEAQANFLSECGYQVHHEDGFIPGEIKRRYTNALSFEIPVLEAHKFALEKTEQVDNYNLRYNLKVLEALDYTEQAVFNFPVTVYDLEREHSFTLNVVVQVQNVESRVPIFTRPFTTQRIKEKEYFETMVTAIDGDTGLNQPICYDLATEEEKYSKYFTIDLDEVGKNGILKVSKIDRDAEKNEFYQFTISAYKCHNRSLNVSSVAAIILDDINDNIPTFDVHPTGLTFWENTLMVLPFERFSINDIDLGAHATYNVLLRENVSGVVLTVDTGTFSIIPNNGYQLTQFTLSIVNAALLDYEVPERQQFELLVTATEDADKSHTSLQTIAIELLNWNDEVPAFDKETYKISIKETIGKDEELLTVYVTDRDVDDRVELKILSQIRNQLRITKLDITDEQFQVPTFGFQISTAQDNIFDWDVASDIIVQLQAEDNLTTAKNEPLHQVFAQVEITVIDVNNKPPSIIVPRGRIHIAENSASSTAVTIGDVNAIIIGTDPDSDANLQFSIDWDSSYAVKAGATVLRDIFEDCLVIDVNSTNRNQVTGKILVNPELEQSVINQKLDYEAYETLFLTLKLVDLNQVIPPGDTEAILVVQLDDENDNPPTFVGNTLETDRFVMEEAETGAIVGSISAIDIDGPNYNVISYTLAPENPAHEGLISIDSTSGLLFVDARHKPIDCDIPVTYDIPLNIYLTDGLHFTNGSLNVNIIDTNNKFPFFTNEVSEVKIFEKSPSGTEILRLHVEDLDRDEAFYTVAFEIDYKTYPELQNYFEVRIADSKPRQQTGLVFVKENNRLLDRDTGIAQFTIGVKVQDNPNSSGRKNSNETRFNLILLDINDHDPVLPTIEEFRLELIEESRLNENAAEGAVLKPRIIATDLDDRNTPNAKINYVLKQITPASGNSPDVVENIENLFILNQVDEYEAQLVLGRDLKGFYGSWTIEIEAYDRGDEYELIEDSPRRSDSATYSVVIDPVNYMKPVINFPKNDERIRIKFESLTNGRPLINTQGETIPNFSATDTDGGAFGVVTFSLESKNAASQDHLYFQLNPLDDHHAQLVLVNADAIEDRSYHVIVRATDGGGLEADKVDVVIAFINMTGEPEFQEQDSPFHTNFTENETGMSENSTIPEAIDPKNAELPPEEHKNVFYFIDTSYGNASHLFKLDKETRLLQLTQQLDREEIPSHEIRVIATNSINGPTGPLSPDSRSQLVVYIKVNDENDNPPKFRYPSYSAGITVNDYTGKTLFEVIADDPDEDDEISYTIDMDSLEAHGENLPTTPSPFALNKDNGQLSLAVLVNARMKGYYIFTIIATDLANHTDTVPAKIYLIAESNRVKFVFLNNVDEINNPDMKNFLEQQFSLNYGMICNIDDVVQGSITENSRAAGDKVTDVRAHFIRDNEAVEAAEIQQRSNDRVFVTSLKTALSIRQLFLQDVPVTSVELIEETSELLKIILIVIASALGIVCVILVVAFCIKIRSLNRQIKAMSATDFGSIASDINGGRQLPTTNVFSVEGSNPVLNDKEFTKGVFDDISVQSYESDFLGIDNDMFANSNKGEVRIAGEAGKGSSNAATNNDELLHRF